MKKYMFLTVFLGVGAVLSAQGFEARNSNLSVRELLEGSKKAPKSDTYYLIALSAARKNEIETANKAIEAGLAANPRNARLLNLKAAIYARQGRLDQAKTIFATVLQMNPNDEYAAKCLNAIDLALQPRYAKRLTPMISSKPSEKKSIEVPVSPISSTVKKDATSEKLLTAVYFEELSHKQDCAHGMSLMQIAYERLISIKPREKIDFSPISLVKEKLLASAPVCPKAGVYSWKDKEVNCSVHGAFKALDSEVTSVFKEYNNGLRAKLGRNYSEALKSFEQVVILYPLWPEAHYQLGDTLFRLGRSDEALNSLRACLKYDSRNLDAQLLMANLYFKKGQKPAALAILDRIGSEQGGTVYGLSARSVAKSIRSGKNYYEIFPPN